MKDRSTTRRAGTSLFGAFLVGDALLLLAAGLLYHQAGRPMNPYELAGFTLCVVVGAWFGTRPFVLRQEAELKRIEIDELAGAVAQIQRVEELARRIDVATGQWQTVQEHAGRTMIAAREIVDRMVAEQKGFSAFFGQANEVERDHLRLEVDKLRRAENDWVQAFVRVLDHVYALYIAGVRSGQATLIEQFGHFQNACRDSARRVGLVAVVATPGMQFDAQVHQLADSGATAPEGAVIDQTLATGYAFQGRLLRRALVTVQAAPATPAPARVESFGSAPQPAALPASAPEQPPTLLSTAPDAAVAPVTGTDLPGNGPSLA